MKTEDEYQEGSAAAWRNLALILLAIVVYGALVWSFHLYLEGQQEHAPTPARRYFWFIMDMTLYGFSIAALMLTQSVWLWNLGRKIVAERRFPAPGVPVGRRVKIQRGTPAVRRGRFLQFCAAVLALSGCGGIAFAVYALMSL